MKQYAGIDVFRGINDGATTVQGKRGFPPCGRRLDGQGVGLEAFPGLRQRGADPRRVPGDHFAGVVSQQTQDAVGVSGGEILTSPRPPLPYSVDPDLVVRIDHDFDPLRLSPPSREPTLTNAVIVSTKP